MPIAGSSKFPGALTDNTVIDLCESTPERAQADPNDKAIQPSRKSSSPSKSYSFYIGGPSHKLTPRILVV